MKSAAIFKSPVRSAAPLSMTSKDSPAPVRLLNKLITWVSSLSTPSRPREEQEDEHDNEQDVEQEEDGVLALTYSPI